MDPRVLMYLPSTKELFRVKGTKNPSLWSPYPEFCLLPHIVPCGLSISNPDGGTSMYKSLENRTQTFSLGQNIQTHLVWTVSMWGSHRSKRGRGQGAPGEELSW